MSVTTENTVPEATDDNLAAAAEAAEQEVEVLREQLEILKSETDTAREKAQNRNRLDALNREADRLRREINFYERVKGRQPGTVEGVEVAEGEPAPPAVPEAPEVVTPPVEEPEPAPEINE